MYIFDERKQRFCGKGKTDKGSDFKHFNVGSVLEVVLFADMLDGRGMKWLVCVPIPFCYQCVTMSPSLVLVISFLSLCLCHISTPLPSFFVDFYCVIKFTIEIWCKPLPRMLVMCLSKLLWWQYFLYLKKEYCGLLGGLTFYRTRHICKSEKKKKKYKNEHLPFLAQGMYKHNYVQKGPFCGLGTLPFSYITSFWYMLLGGFLFLVSPGGCIRWTYLLHGRKQGNSGLELHDVGYVY